VRNPEQSITRESEGKVLPSCPVDFAIKADSSTSRRNLHRKVKSRNDAYGSQVSLIREFTAPENTLSK